MIGFYLIVLFVGRGILERRDNEFNFGEFVEVSERESCLYYGNRESSFVIGFK